MDCPFCQAVDTKVMDSRLSLEGKSIRRRRRCPSCEKRFTTYEQVELSLPDVVKSDGRREAYSRSKLVSGIKKACQKRPISSEQIEEAVNTLERAVLDTYEKEVPSSALGNLVMSSLRDLDPVAYVRFASVYKTFKDIDEFFHDLREHMEIKKAPAETTL